MTYAGVISVKMRHPAWCVWHVDNLFVYEEFARVMEWFSPPEPPAQQGTASE